MNGKQEKVRLTITGLQRAEGDETCVEMTVWAECMRRDGDCFLFYEEQVEGFEETVKCLIKWQNGRLERIRRGEPKLHMIFEEGCLHETDYPTPYGLLRLGIKTRRVEYCEVAEGFSFHVDYRLERNGDVLSECMLKIMVCSGIL
ncbi:MAG: DUF1934 domain-containing protein [Roseburia sp.]|nr:DUF1934 domain-containing protein [Roseburia sp.]